VGLGPGGSVAARILAERGMRVLALEKERIPRYKPCGGVLSARVLNLLDVDLKTVIKASIYGGTFTFCGAEHFSARYHKPVAYMVMRPQFDQFLSQRARCAGANIHEGERVHTIRPRETEVEVATSHGVYRAAWLIGADGAKGIVRQYVTQESRAVPIAGLEAEIITEQRILQQHAQEVVLDFGKVPNGYSWIFPKSNHLSVGIFGAFRQVAHPRHLLWRFLTDQGFNVSAGEEFHGHLIPIYQGGHTPVQRQRIVLVGDAAKLVEPFFGEGIYYAIKSAQIASRMLLDHVNQMPPSGEQYERYLQELSTELRAALKVARLLYRFPRYGYHLFKTHNTLVQSYFKVLCGENSFVRFYSVIRRKALTNILSCRFQ
jgi:geranylgeranyl reductase family protein